MATFKVVSSTHAIRPTNATSVKITRPGTLMQGDLLLAFQFFGAERVSKNKNIGGFRNYQTGSVSFSGERRTLTYFPTTYVFTPVALGPGGVIGATVLENEVVATWRTFTATYVSWRITFAHYTTVTTPSWWTPRATLIVMVAVRFPSAAFNITNFEALTVVQNLTGVSSRTLTVSPAVSSDIVFLAAVQQTSTGTFTFPSGSTSLASSNSGCSAAVAYMSPGTGSHTETISSTKTSRMAALALVVTQDNGPPVPSLTAPPATVIMDVTTGVTFTATYFSSLGAPQNAYALRIRTSTSLAWQYWNASTSSLQSSIVWNATATTPGKSWSVSVPHTILSNNAQYVWSMAARTAAVNKDGDFATTVTFTTATKPTVAVTGFTGHVTTAHPLVKFSWTTAPTFVLTSVRVVVYTQAQHTISTFTPGVSPSFWDSGTIA